MRKGILTLTVLAAAALTACGPGRQCTQYAAVHHVATGGYAVLVGRIPVYVPGQPAHDTLTCVAWEARRSPPFAGGAGR